MLQANSTLRSLDLICNNIGDIGVKELAEMLKVNYSLTKFNHIGNHMGKTNIELIDSYVKRNKNINDIVKEKINARSAVLEQDLKIEWQIELKTQIRIEKLNTLENIVAKILAKLKY